MIIGRLGHDPELRYTQSGQPVATLSVATDESYRAQDGQKVERTEWHRVIVWGKQAEFCGNYLSKGRLVYVEGKVETRKWQDKQGIERYTTEIRAFTIQALDPKPEGARLSDSYDDQFSAGESTMVSIMDEAPF
jgi:single-strand DNA-binding protein